MKPNLNFFIAIFLSIGCSQPKENDKLALTFQKWGIREINIENFDNHNLISYYQAEDTNGYKGYVEVKGNKSNDTELTIYDGKGNTIIKSLLKRTDDYGGGYEGETVFFNKPNVKHTSAAMARTGNPFQSKEIAVVDPLIQTHSIIRFIPNFFNEGGTTIHGVQFDLPATRESVFVSLLMYKDPSKASK